MYFIDIFLYIYIGNYVLDTISGMVTSTLIILSSFVQEFRVLPDETFANFILVSPATSVWLRL